MATAFAGHQTPAVDDVNLQIDSFFPAVTIVNLQAHSRDDVECSPGEMRLHLQRAVYAVNDQVRTFRADQRASKLADVVVSSGNHRAGTQLVTHYLAAVYATAKAALLGNYPDATHTRDDTTQITQRIRGYQSCAHADIKAFYPARSNVTLI